MFRVVALFFGAILRLLHRRQSLLLENLALRQQVSVLKRKNPPTQADKMRSVLLDRSQSILVGVEEFPAVSETRNRRGVASSSVSHLLATEMQSTPGRKKAHLGRAPADNIPHGQGESHLGSTLHSRRTADAWLRPLGTIYLALDGTLS